MLDIKITCDECKIDTLDIMDCCCADCAAKEQDEYCEAIISGIVGDFIEANAFTEEDYSDNTWPSDEYESAYLNGARTYAMLAALRLIRICGEHGFDVTCEEGGNECSHAMGELLKKLKSHIVKVENEIEKNL